MTGRVYISGPMTGLPDFNRPAFNAEAGRLRSLGYPVESPAEILVRSGDEWGDLMRIALAKLLLCETLVQLPGWEKSRGAVIERELADRLGMRVVNVGELA